MAEPHYRVDVTYDDEANVWYVSDSDVPGLAAEAKTKDEMREVLESLIPDLIEWNTKLVPSIAFDVNYIRSEGGE